MKIVVDDKIPYIQPALKILADEVLAKAGSEISSADVRDADILVVRTRTICNRRLLEGSHVKLVVTATIGFDHIDTGYLEATDIKWTNCPGCNATSVAQYVANSLLLMRRDRGLDLEASTLGIVGIGHVGTAVMEAAQRIGIKRILPNDPPREATGDHLPDGTPWADLNTLITEADIITLHTPLTSDGPYPTRYILNALSFQMMKRRPVIINAGRGGLINELALEAAIDADIVSDVVLDTWEHEPHISHSLLNKVYIGTPHIAGYSADGKANATRMALEAICRYLGRPMSFDIPPPALPPSFIAVSSPNELALQLYDPLLDSKQLKAFPEHFEQLRGNYPLRREHL